MSYEEIVKVLADLIVSIDLAGEDLIDTDFASGILDQVAAVMERLDEGERVRIAEIIQRYANSQTDGRRGNAIGELPNDLGLILDDE